MRLVKDNQLDPQVPVSFSELLDRLFNDSLVRVEAIQPGSRHR